MRIAFAGTPAFAVPALQALHQAGHQILAVYTQPDRPAGRGRHLQASAVASFAGALGLPVFKPERLDAAAQAQLRELAPEVLVVVAYGQILPPAVLAIPRHGCLNIHASLLPRWRGAAPLQRAILAGDAETGVTIMRMDAGLDTGPVLLRARLPITAATTTADLHDALASLGAQLIVEALRRLQDGGLEERPQPEEGVSYAHKISKDEARIDWQQPATLIQRQVRAYNPVPVAWTLLDDERLRIFQARLATAAAPAAPGTIVRADAEGLLVATGDGSLLVTRLQWPGGRLLDARQAIAGRELEGRRLG